MCSYRPWWWWMASSRSCSSEGKSTSPHALHQESTLLMYCRARQARSHLHKLPLRYKVFRMRHDMRQCCIHRYTLPRSHMLVRHTRVCKKSPEGHFSIPSLSLNRKKCPFIWLWALWRLYQKNYSWLSVLFIGLWWLPGTFCTPTWEGRKNKPISEAGLKEISESWWFHYCW